MEQDNDAEEEKEPRWKTDQKGWRKHKLSENRASLHRQLDKLIDVLEEQFPRTAIVDEWPPDQFVKNKEIPGIEPNVATAIDSVVKFVFSLISSRLDFLSEYVARPHLSNEEARLMLSIVLNRLSFLFPAADGGGGYNAYVHALSEGLQRLNEGKVSEFLRPSVRKSRFTFDENLHRLIALGWVEHYVANGIKPTAARAQVAGHYGTTISSLTPGKNSPGPKSNWHDNSRAYFGNDPVEEFLAAASSDTYSSKLRDLLANLGFEYPVFILPETIEDWTKIRRHSRSRKS